MKCSILILWLGIIISSCNGPQVPDARNIKDSANSLLTGADQLYFDSTSFESLLKEHKFDSGTTKQLQSFYKCRNYMFAWFTKDGISDITRIFWNLHENYIHDFVDTAATFRKVHQDISQELSNTGRSSLQKKTIAELELTSHFFVYVQNAYAGRGNPTAMQWFIPRKKLDPVALLNSFIARKGKNTDEWEPVNTLYKRLKKELLHYGELAKSGGFGTIRPNQRHNYKPGDSSVTIKQIRQRIQALGNKNVIDTSQVYSEDLLLPIKSLQRSFGLREDGIITPALIKELNVPVNVRISQMLLNLERMRWLPAEADSEFIAANIPEFRLHVFEGEKKVFSIDIVVGQAAHNTVIFADKLKYVVFSPYWNVPPSIVRKEILPAMRRNSNYLARNNMEQKGTAGGLPIIRQKPGGANALGKVKFIFPNSYNIYFHDTPSKALF
ncbi:MAG: L,D-transpeptidase family protein, partial [Chitinophagaceae bacterium]